jgi:hypothetical protein
MSCHAIHQRNTAAVRRHLRFVAGIVILATGCTDDVSQDRSSTGVDIRPSTIGPRTIRPGELLQASSAATVTAASPFTYYQFAKKEFTLAPGQTSGSGAALCPPGTQVVGGGVSSAPSLMGNYWITDTYPGYVPETQQYGWQGIVERPDTSSTSQTLTTVAICVN